MDRVAIRKCSTMEEALIVTAMLQDGGFDAVVDNYHATMDWGSIIALGGVIVSVPHSEFEAAKSYIIEMAATAEDRLEAEFDELDEAPPSANHAKAWSMLFIFLGGGILLIWPIFYALSLLPESWILAMTPGDTEATVTQSKRYVAGNIPMNDKSVTTMLMLAGLFSFAVMEGLRRTSKNQEDDA